MNNKVFVGNLPWSIRTPELSALLTEMGFTYRSVKVIEDKVTGRSRGFAFVEFDTPEAAAEAIVELTGVVCEGRALFANQAEDTKSGRTSSGGIRERPLYPPDETEHKSKSKSNKPKRERSEKSVW